MQTIVFTGIAAARGIGSTLTAAADVHQAVVDVSFGSEADVDPRRFECPL
jgi:hypothetical protein